MNRRKKYEKCFEISTEIRCQNENETEINNEIIVEIKILFFLKKNLIN